MDRKFYLQILIVLCVVWSPASRAIADAQNHQEWPNRTEPKYWTASAAEDPNFENDRSIESSLDSTGGPDPMGYYFVDNQGPDTAVYSWIELRGAAGVTWINAFSNSDEGWVSQIPIGFPFVLYDSVYTDMIITTNGTIQFTNSYTTWENRCLPVPAFEAAIFPYWDDLNLTTGGIPTGTNVVGVKTFDNYTVIEFDSIGRYHGDNPASLKFEVILYANGRIKLQYRQMNLGGHGGEATVGIQGTDDDQYLEYVCNGRGSEIGAGRAIWFYRPNMLAHDFQAETASSAGYCLTTPGQSEAVQAIFRNLGYTTEACPIKYRFDNGTIVTETTNVLAALQSELHTFTIPLTAPATPGTYRLKVWADLPTDGNRSNDTLTFDLTVASCSLFECAEIDTEGYWEIDCNGGCNNEEEPLWQEISCGQTVCGIGYTYGYSYRDTDWFRFTVTERTSISVRGYAEFSMQMLILSGECPTTTIARAYSRDSCAYTDLTVNCLLPGDYFLWVGPYNYYQLPLSDSLRYSVTLSCRSSAFEVPPNDRCEDAGTPQPLPAIFTGDNACAARDCDYIRYGIGETWHSFVLDSTCDIMVDYCGCGSDWDDYSDVLFAQCPCYDPIGYYSYDQCSNGNLRIIFSQLLSGIYYLPILRSDGYGAAGPYTVSVTAVDPCTHADYSLTAPGQLTGTLDDAGDECWVDNFGHDEHIIQITIPYEGNWTFSMCNSPEEFPSELILTTQCCGGEILEHAEGGCNDSYFGLSLIPGVHLNAGAYYLIVTEYWRSSGDIYTLDVIEEPPCNPDFSVAAPGTWSGNTSLAQNNCWQRPAQDVTYAVTVPYTASWKFSLCSAETQVRTHIYLSTDCCGGNLITDDQNSCGGSYGPSVIWHQLLEAGTYYLTIEGQYVNDCGPYQLTIEEWIPCAVYQPGDVIECVETDSSSHWTTDCNGGCGEEYSYATYLYQDLNCGQSVLGMVFTDSYYYNRDWDMYRFILTEPATARVSVFAEFPVAIAIDRIDTCDYAPPIAYSSSSLLCSEVTAVTPGPVAAGEYMFWVVPMTYVGLLFSDSTMYRASLACEPLAAELDNAPLVTSYALYQNAPNPFNPETRIAFDLVKGGMVTLRIYNLLGQQVAELLNGVAAPGHHQIMFNGSNLPSGIYFYRLETEGFVDQKKMLLLK